MHIPNQDSTSKKNLIFADIKQINHYYPFGLNMEGNWNGAQGNNKYQYNNKEWNDDFGLGWNDYGARFYDPAMSRWVAIDPLAEKYMRWSVYNYTKDNPIKYIDPDGRSVQGDFYNEKGKRIGTDGIKDGNKYIVFDKSEAKSIEAADKAGGTTQMSSIKSGVFISKDIMAAADKAVEAQDKTGFEHGFVAATDGTTSSLLTDGKDGEVRLGKGYQELEAAGKTSAFDVHTHPQDFVDNNNGTFTASSPEPSGTAGKKGGRGDYNYRGLKEEQGKVTTANSWVIGMRATATANSSGNLTPSYNREVSFYNNSATVKTMDWKDFKKLADKVLK